MALHPRHSKSSSNKLHVKSSLLLLQRLGRAQFTWKNAAKKFEYFRFVVCWIGLIPHAPIHFRGTFLQNLKGVFYNCMKNFVFKDSLIRLRIDLESRLFAQSGYGFTSQVFKDKKVKKNSDEFFF